MSLTVRDLTKKYGEKTVVDRLSFEMPKPGVYALLGTNGAGKTTSIRMMLGMLARDGGEVFWNGAPLSTDTCNVGYLAEERGLYPKYTLMDQLMYFAILRGIKRDEAKRRIREWSAKLNLDEYLYPPRAVRKSLFSGFGKSGDLRGAAPVRETGPSKKADQLSKGNQQKIQLMTALISDPELIVLDEPLSGLDPVNTDLFKGIIREQIERGKYLIMSSHQMATVEEFCREITIMDRAKTVLQGNLDDIKRGYGRVNLRIKSESEIEGQIAACGMQTVDRIGFDYHLKVKGEEQANSLLRRLILDGVQLVAFELREPSLHEIFVEKVGTHDAEK